MNWFVFCRRGKCPLTKKSDNPQYNQYQRLYSIETLYDVAPINEIFKLSSTIVHPISMSSRNKEQRIQKISDPDLLAPNLEKGYQTVAYGPDSHHFECFYSFA